MSEENVETVRAIVDQTAQGDFSRWLDDVTDDFVFVTSPDIPDAGTYRGEAAKDWLTAWVESFVGHTIEASDFIDAGDKVFSSIATPTTSGSTSLPGSAQRPCRDSQRTS